MERDIEEILASQKRMLKRIGVIEEKPVPDEDMQKYFQTHLDQVKSFLAEEDWLKVLFVSYNQVLCEPEKEFQRVAEFLDDIVDPAAMASVVDPELYRERH